MNSNTESLFLKRSILTLLGSFIQFPYLILVMYIGTVIIRLTSFPDWIIFIPLLFRLLQLTLSFFVWHYSNDKKISSCIRIDTNTNINLFSDQDTINRLEKLRLHLSQATGLDLKNLIFYIFPERGNFNFDPRHKNCYASVMKDEWTICLSERLLSKNTDEVMIGVLAHELGHLVRGDFYLAIFNSIFTYPAKNILIWITIYVGWYYGWLPFIAISLFFWLINGAVTNLPSRTFEKTADLFASVNGYGNNLILAFQANWYPRIALLDYLNNLVGDHPATRSRIKSIEQNMFKKY